MSSDESTYVRMTRDKRRAILHDFIIWLAQQQIVLADPDDLLSTRQALAKAEEFLA